MLIIEQGYSDAVASRKAVNVSEYLAHSSTNDATGCIKYDGYYDFLKDYKLFFNK